MPKYIERDSLLKKAKSLQGKLFAVPLILDAIEYAPAVDVVEVKHGEWHLLYNCANEGVYCSVCHKKVYKTDYANQKIKSPFCPNCGAKMDLKEGAEECR